jgi:deoxyinosine 3'endonuclease (endonuclease V)
VVLGVGTLGLLLARLSICCTAQATPPAVGWKILIPNKTYSGWAIRNPRSKNESKEFPKNRVQLHFTLNILKRYVTTLQLSNNSVVGMKMIWKTISEFKYSLQIRA